ncbi:DNA-methyltransferase [Labedella endophytica]|uniref:DNA-methyltransferase n=1 Tax=Labedella endophytica TaxID=1523160 RepID=UPI003C7D6B4B
MADSRSRAAASLSGGLRKPSRLSEPSIQVQPPENYHRLEARLCSGYPTFRWRRTQPDPSACPIVFPRGRHLARGRTSRGSTSERPSSSTTCRFCRDVNTLDILLDRSLIGADHHVRGRVHRPNVDRRRREKRMLLQDHPPEALLGSEDREPYMAPGLVTPEKAARGKLPTDVWWHTIVSPTGNEKTGYPTQKPLGVLRRIVQASSREGDWVLDFFAGSGTTGAAAAELGRNYVLVDSNPAAIEVMRKRLQRP